MTTTNNNAATTDMSSLFAAVRARACLEAIVGVYDYSRALEAARAIEHLSPGDFPAIANQIVDGDPCGAVWCALQILADTPGAWDAWSTISRRNSSCEEVAA